MGAATRAFMRAAPYAAGAGLYAPLAYRAWRGALDLVPWNVYAGSGGVGFVSGGPGDALLLFGLPLIGSALIARRASSTPLAATLHRAHVITWFASIVALALAFMTHGPAGLWLLVLGVLLVPAQITILVAALVVLFAVRVRRTA